MIELSDLPSYGLPEVKEINDRISYIPACEKPLSADVVIVRGEDPREVKLGCERLSYRSDDLLVGGTVAV